MAAEKTFENKIKKFLTEQGCYFVKYFGCGFTQAGVPDLLVCCNGRFVGIEVKAENGRASELQKHNIHKIRRSGGIGMVVRPSEFEDFKQAILDLCQ